MIATSCWSENERYNRLTWPLAVLIALMAWLAQTLPAQAQAPTGPALAAVRQMERSLRYHRGRVSVVAPLVATESLWGVAFSALLLRRSELVGRRLVLGALLIVAGGVVIGVSAPSGDKRRAPARDHAAPGTALALAKATSLGCGRVRPLAWCSRPGTAAASPEEAQR